MRLGVFRQLGLHTDDTFAAGEQDVEVRDSSAALALVTTSDHGSDSAAWIVLALTLGWGFAGVTLGHRLLQIAQCDSEGTAGLTLPIRPGEERVCRWAGAYGSAGQLGELPSTRSGEPEGDLVARGTRVVDEGDLAGGTAIRARAAGDRETPRFR
jgi:hypothetical protein